MDTHELTNDLFNDLLDPRIPTLDVCRRHAVPVTDLRRILASAEFQEAATALIAAEELRSKALAPDRRERALATLDAITRQEPTTPSHTECIRRAASALLRAARPEPPARAAAPARENAATPEADEHAHHAPHAPHASPGVTPAGTAEPAETNGSTEPDAPALSAAGPNGPP